MKTAALLVVLTITEVAIAADLDRHREFQHRGVFDASVSNSDANAIVAEGIASADPEVVHATIAALGLHGMFRHGPEDMPLPPFGPLPRRSFAEVPGLKAFLIRHWREQHEESGYNAFGVSSVQDSSWGLDENLLDPPADLTWRMIPNILCTIYPGDPEVHDLLWEINDTESGPIDEWHPGYGPVLLRLLNRGMFTTPKANAYRLRELAAPRGGEVAFVAVGQAATGLAMSRPPEALPALIAAGKAHPRAQDEVLVALAAYGDAALSAHTEELADLVSRARTRSTAAREAAHRLRSLWSQAAEPPRAH